MIDSVFDKILDDIKYSKMKKKLERLENKIHSRSLSRNEEIDYIEKAINVANEIYLYSLNNGYADFYIKKYGNNHDEYELNKLKDLLEHTVIFSKYENALGFEKLKIYDEAIKIYYHILKNYIPSGTVYYERPAILLEKQKRYDESLEVCELALTNIAKFNLKIPEEDFSKRKERLLKKINKPDKIQKSLKPKSKNNVVTKEVTVTSTANVPQQIINFPNWYVSISFGVSRSENYPQAVALAKLAPQYIENIVEGKSINQAIYSSNPKEYLKFIKLYELVSHWKSCFVVINGELIDRKIIGGLNYCYGDKCRSGNPDFCYGASPMTSNPFGCHRLQISAYNHPWWSFGNYDTAGIWHIDKQSILKRIEEYSIPYQKCPCFSMEKVNTAVNSIPDKINPNKDKNWQCSFNGVQPNNYNSVLSINSDLDDFKEENINDTNNTTSVSNSIDNSTSKNRSFFTILKSLFKK